MRQAHEALMRMQRLREAMMETLATGRRREPARALAWRPSMDLVATPEAYLLRFDVPGVAHEDIKASAEGGVVRMQGTAALPDDLRGASVLRAERRAGKFARSVRLPGDADVTDLTARLSGGVLEIRVARHRRDAARIDIEIGS